jgi:hypothetical protein
VLPVYRVGEAREFHSAAPAALFRRWRRL